MTDHELRLMLLNPKYHKRINELMPSASDVGVFEALGVFGQLTSVEYANWREISIPNASQQLKACYDKGYLTRVTTNAVSGGHEFIYTAKY